MEICLNDEWGTVCNQMWDATDAGVVCRQLGFPSIGIFKIMAEGIKEHCLFAEAETLIQAEGGGRIWLHNVQCTGRERALIDCTSISSGVNSCTHAQDAGVRCQYGKFCILSISRY